MFCAANATRAAPRCPAPCADRATTTALAVRRCTRGKSRADRLRAGARPTAAHLPRAARWARARRATGRAAGRPARARRACDAASGSSTSPPSAAAHQLPAVVLDRDRRRRVADRTMLVAVVLEGEFHRELVEERVEQLAAAGADGVQRVVRSVVLEHDR